MATSLQQEPTLLKYWVLFHPKQFIVDIFLVKFKTIVNRVPSYQIYINISIYTAGARLKKIN